MLPVIKIGTRESELAVWQANMVKTLLAEHGHESCLVYIKSEGDLDLKTPLYEMGVQGIFTRSLDIALLNNKIDMAVHSMKDVPTQLPVGIAQAAVIKRGNHKDLLVFNDHNLQSEERVEFKNSLATNIKTSFSSSVLSPLIASSSIRRKAQWLYRYPNSVIDNIRGNVNTRLQKLSDSKWHGAIFAAAGLERINKRPSSSIELDWMLPAPAQGAVMVAARHSDTEILNAAKKLNDQETDYCTRCERDFLRLLLGGCSTPISALATIQNDLLFFKGNIFSPDGKEAVFVDGEFGLGDVSLVGREMAEKILKNGGDVIVKSIRNEQ